MINLYCLLLNVSYLNQVKFEYSLIKTNHFYSLLSFKFYIDVNCTFDRFLIYEPSKKRIRSKRTPIGIQKTSLNNLDFRRFLIGNQVIRTSSNYEQNKDNSSSKNKSKSNEEIKNDKQLKSINLLSKTLEYDKPTEIYCGKKEPNSKYLSKGSKLVLRFVTDDFGEYLGFSINYKFVSKEDAKNLKEHFIEQRIEEKKEEKKDLVEYEFEPKDAEVSIGSSHMLKCKPKGYSKLNLISNQFNQLNESTETIKWFKDDNEITTDLNEDKTVLLVREFHLSSTGS